MNTRKVAKEYRLAQWGQVIQSRVESGLSIKDYCQTAGISKNTYFYWQRKLREAACIELAQREAETGTGLMPSGWTRLESEVAAESAVTIEIGGCHVQVTAETDTDLLLKVCRALKFL